LEMFHHPWKISDGTHLAWWPWIWHSSDSPFLLPVPELHSMLLGVSCAMLNLLCSARHTQKNDKHRHNWSKFSLCGFWTSILLQLLVPPVFPNGLFNWADLETASSSKVASLPSPWILYY
jgi:hypothetical protein